MTGQDLQKAQDWTSRKYRSAWILTVILLGLFVIPPIVGLLLTVFWQEVEWVLLPVSGFGTLLMMIWGFYFGANVAEKHKAFNVKQTPFGLLDEVTEDEGDGYGGQPPDADNP